MAGQIRKGRTCDPTARNYPTVNLGDTPKPPGTAVLEQTDEYWGEHPLTR